ncbi:hypothetical protein HGB24_03355 [Candidatus Saccharibacteria bacterium]|nr:hypothetical protein [Candidatus Saccharibacteria bacterium]
MPGRELHANKLGNNVIQRVSVPHVQKYIPNSYFKGSTTKLNARPMNMKDVQALIRFLESQ